MILTSKESDFSHIKDYQMKASRGVVVVEMQPRGEQKNGLYLPGDVQNHFRSDLGYVVASGREDIPEGSKVYVRHDRGKCVDGFGWDERIAKSETRFYGINGGFDFAGTGNTSLCHRYDVSEAIYCFHDMKPIGKNILVKLAPKPDEVNGIYLNKVQRDPVAEVLEVGSKVEHFSKGDKIVIHEGALSAEEMALLDAEGFEDCAFINEDFIYAKLG